MGDSDEEYDRRRPRDKFRGERSDYQDRSGRNRREDWSDSRDSGGGWGINPSGTRDRMNNRGGNRDYSRDSYGGNQRRDRYGSPADRSDMSPPMKRIRNSRDWDERDNHVSGSHANSSSYSTSSSHSGHNQSETSTGPTQPALLTFKQFLATQDDSVDDMEAVKKYNEYKMDFKRQQINDFFLAHKDEEWFRSRYHPDECGKRKAAIMNSHKNRLKVFLELLNNDWIDSVSIDVEKSDQIIRLLDAAVIKLEGGTDFDLKALDTKFEDEKPKEPDLSIFSVDVEKPLPKNENEWTDNEEKKLNQNESNKEFSVKNKESEIKKDELKGEDEEIEEGENEEEKAPESEEKPKRKEIEEEEEEEGIVDDSKEEKSLEEEEGEEKKEEKMESGEVDGEDGVINDSAVKPRPLHKKDSIFLRNIAPNITKAEIEQMCRKFPGFLRVALADPAPDRKFYRRGWVTFEKLEKIREICWQMTSIKIRECELGAIVNRDLTRRIRSVNGIASHKNVIRADIRHAAKIVFNLDQQRKLWEDEKDPKKDGNEETPVFGLQSKNPLLNNIADYLIEEASAEEEELLGGKASEVENEEVNMGQALERDENLIKVLDRLLLFLRIVHSVDYYNHSDYPNEDEMPNRIGIMHARGAPPSSKVTNQEINDYIKAFETKIQPFLQPPPKISEEEIVKLGKKDPEKEIEEFIKANIQDMGKGKWLCPLSGKKFKGPDFVRKHIFNKHEDRLEEVRKDVEYFNNYLSDPKRPQLPEHPSNRPASQQTTSRTDGNTAGHNGPTTGAGPWLHPHAPYPTPPPYLQGYGPPRGAPPLGFAGPMAGWAALGRSYPPMGPPIDYTRGGMAARGRYAASDTLLLPSFLNILNKGRMIAESGNQCKNNTGK